MLSTHFLRYSTVFILLACQYAVAHGGMEGGGGKGVQCGTQVRVLDLYEAENIHHLRIPTGQNDLKADVTRNTIALSYYLSEVGFDRNSAAYHEAVFNYIKSSVIDNFSDIKPGTRLPFTPDATLPSLPDGCSFVQIALYADDGTIYRDRNYWDRLTIQDQAALILHEVMYRDLRLHGETTSDTTRYMIGLTFAEQLPEPILKPLWGEPGAWTCTTHESKLENFELFAINEIRDGKSGIGIYFTNFKNLTQYERTYAFVPEVEVVDLYIGKASISAAVESSLSKRKWMFEYAGKYTGKNEVEKIRAWSQSDSEPEFSSAECVLRVNGHSFK